MKEDKTFNWLKEMPMENYNYLTDLEDVKLMDIIHNIVKRRDKEFNNKLEQLKQIIRNAFTTTDENGNETCEINMGLIDTFIDEKIEELKQ